MSAWSSVARPFVEGPIHAATALRSALLGSPLTWSWPRREETHAPAIARPPIDVVYTWVDGTDPEWAAARARWQRATGADSVPHAASARRFRDNDELRYSLRALEKNVPFFRRLFLVTSGQVPRWLARDHPRLCLVRHEDVFADRAWLPTFNSDAIELHLWRIPDLAEHFLYLNDDLFVLDPVSESTFLDAEGRARVFLTRRLSALRRDAARDVHYAGLLHTYARLDAVLGPSRWRVHAHAPIVQRRSVHREIARLFAEDVARTAAHRFRDPRDLKIAFNVYPHYLLRRGLGVRGHAAWSHVHLGDDERRNRAAFEMLRRVRPTFMCLMDGMDEPSEACLRALRASLEELLPEPSSFERSGRGA